MARTRCRNGYGPCALDKRFGPLAGTLFPELEKHRADEAIETKGGSSGEPEQAVFDVGSGQFRTSERADGADDAGEDDPAAEKYVDPATEAVLDELKDTDQTGTSPVELTNRAQAWQERLDE